MDGPLSEYIGALIAPCETTCNITDVQRLSFELQKIFLKLINATITFKEQITLRIEGLQLSIVEGYIEHRSYIKCIMFQGIPQLVHLGLVLLSH